MGNLVVWVGSLWILRSQTCFEARIVTDAHLENVQVRTRAPEGLDDTHVHWQLKAPLTNWTTDVFRSETPKLGDPKNHPRFVQSVVFHWKWCWWHGVPVANFATRVAPRFWGPFWFCRTFTREAVKLIRSWSRTWRIDLPSPNTMSSAPWIPLAWLVNAGVSPHGGGMAWPTMVQSNPCGGCLRIRDDEVQWHHGNLDGVDIGPGFGAGTLVPCCHPAWVAYLAYLLLICSTMDCTWLGNEVAIFFWGYSGEYSDIL